MAAEHRQLTEEEKTVYIRERTKRYADRKGFDLTKLPYPDNFALGLFAHFHPTEFFETLGSGGYDDILSGQCELPTESHEPKPNGSEPASSAERSAK